MKRLIIRHSRDRQVLPGYRWELWCKDTHDPHAEPLFVGYGSYRGCRLAVIDLLFLKREWADEQFEIDAFSTPMPKPGGY